MVPGMHCSGGPGPNSFDRLTALEDWVEKGKAPKRVIASHSTAGLVDRPRPLCVYPKVAVYTGSGSSDDAANGGPRASLFYLRRRFMIRHDQLRTISK
jgi:feruloyl esterase